MKRRMLKGIVSAALFAAAMPAVTRAETLVTLSDTGNASTNFDNLQAAINSATLDTRIQLPAGATFSKTASSISLPNKTTGSGYITLESLSMASLPGVGHRVATTDATNMPKILANSNNAPAIKCAASAHHYRLRGLEISSTTAGTFTSLVEFGAGGSTQNSLTLVPHHLEIDHCYIHAFDDTQTLTRDVSLQSGNTRILDSYLSGAKTPTADSQAIQGNNGTGPYFIINNYLEGAGENVLIGGGGTYMAGVLPSDVTVKRNYMAKPTSWLPNFPLPTTGSSQNKWMVKNLFEVKFGHRFDIENNLFERSWGEYGGQEFAIAFKVDSNNDSSNLQSDTNTQDILFTYNKVQHAAGGLMVQGRDWSAGWAPSLTRCTVTNNLFTDISRATWGYTSAFGGGVTYVNNGADNVKIDHNTGFGDRFTLGLDASSYPETSFTFTNNMFNGPYSGWGVYGDNGGQTGDAALAVYAPTVTFTKNVLEAVNSSLYTTHTANWWPSSWTGVLVNQASGDYHVVNPSVYHNAGTDSKDIGCDVDGVNNATTNCSTGIWPANDIVLYAKDATNIHGPWTVTTDSAAGGGAYLQETDQGLAKVSPALASPTSYWEMTFNAQAGVGYHLWIRQKAPNTSSDSVHAQFDHSVDASNTAICRIGTANSIELVLENGSGTGISNWGWRDSKWGTTTAETRVYFSQSGPQTIRIQRREDGPGVDEILLSPVTNINDGPANANPGTEKDDTTILQKNTGSNGDIVIYPSKAPTKVDWASTSDVTAAGGAYIGQSHSTQAKIATPLASPTSYFETTFQAQAGVPYHIWFRGRALSDDFNNDSVYAQFDQSTDSGGTAKWRIGSTDATVVILEEGSGAGDQGWGWNDNNYGAVSTDYVYFSTSGTQTIRVQQREDGYQIDEMVLSPVQYLTASPGIYKNDTTILPEQ